MNFEEKIKVNEVNKVDEMNKIDGVDEINKIPKVPVLFIIFNRLDIVKQVFEAIREYQPEELFIACDGARKDKENEQERIQEVQKYVLDNVNWNCKVETNFLKDNLSPARAVSSFLIWFFNKVEYGIVLEHDCLVERDFFDFCAELLIRKRIRILFLFRGLMCKVLQKTVRILIISLILSNFGVGLLGVEVLRDMIYILKIIP